MVVDIVVDVCGVELMYSSRTREEGVGDEEEEGMVVVVNYLVKRSE